MSQNGKEKVKQSNCGNPLLRDWLKEWMEQAQGIQSLVHYPQPIHLQPGYKQFAPSAYGLPVTEKLAKTELSLPMYPSLKPSDAGQVIAAIRQFFAS